MLKVMKIKSADGVEKYLTQGKEHYYSEGLEEKGIWLGGESLGYSGDVQHGDLKKILEGRNRDGVLQGQVHEKRQVGWDCTFSAPKSVSIAWAFAEGEDRKKIEEAHDKAVVSALDYLKTYALDNAVRRGKGGLVREAVKEIPIAVYKHFTSRENDMQIHSHAILPNLALRSDGTFGGIQPDQVFKRMQEIGAIYQAELGKNLKSIGYSIENAKNSIRISNISEKIEEIFSKRSKIISDLIESENAISSKHKDAIKKISRKNKTHTTPDIVKDTWLKELNQNGYKLENIQNLNQKNVDLRNQLSSKENKDLKEQIIKKVVEHMSNTKSTFHEFELRKEIASQSRASFGRDEIIELIEKAKNSSEIIEIGERHYTTRHILEIENDLREQISLMNRFENHQCTKESIENALKIREDGKVLSDEQINMVKHIVQGESIKVVEGLPGTGKSFALSRACDVFIKNGYNVKGLAPTGKASENLEDLNIKSATVDKFLYDLRNEKDSFSHMDVIIVDESAMLGSKKTYELIKHASECGAKIILCGDSKQLQPMDAGGAFRMVKNTVGYLELKDIRRQNQEWYRETIYDIRNGNVEKALLSYLDHNMIKISDNQYNMIKNITEKYISERRDDLSKSQLVLCGTNYQVQKLNESIRASLKDEGAIQKEKYCKIQVKNINNEKVEKEFCVKDRIYFLQNSNKINVKNGSLGVIYKISKNKNNEVIFDVKLDNNKKIKVNTKEYQKIDHGYACTVHKSQGSTVDKVHVAIDRMDNEMSGVALSRHREKAIIYTNKENHEYLFKSYEAQKNKPLNLSNDFKLAIENLNKTMSKSNQKDTTQDYIKEQKEHHNIEYVTNWHLVKSNELMLSHDNIRKFEILKEMSTLNLGVENPFLEPKKGFSKIQLEAFRIIERGEFNHSEIEKFNKLIHESTLGQKSMIDKAEFINERVNKLKKTFDRIYEKIKPMKVIENEIKENMKNVFHKNIDKQDTIRERIEKRGRTFDGGHGFGR